MAATYENANPDPTEALAQNLSASNLAHKVPSELSGPNGSHDVPNGDSDDEDAAADAATNGADGTAAAKKKKKNKKSGAAKRKAAKASTVTQVGEQTEPPTIGLSKLFPNGVYPVGEIQQYDETKFLDENRARTSLEELKERERLEQAIEGNDYNLVRRAGEAHRQVRQYAQRAIKPGMTMTSIANLIEDNIRTIIEAEGLTCGIAFPTGLSLNEVAAHYTPNAGDKRVLQASDVLKVDIGIHYSGRIVDSAFTMTFNESKKWDPLLEAVKEATNAGIKGAGIDVILGELGGEIQEVMESHEFEVDGKTQQVKCVRNLTGHSIDRYSIHGSHQVPIVLSPDVTDRMVETAYAIETFGTTGKGYVFDKGECSHYSRIKDVAPTSLHLASAQKLLYTIGQQFGTLPFCRRYLDRVGEKNYLLGLRHLVQQGIVQDYPPLADIPGSMTAQFEHTILLRPTCKEVVSRGDDY